MGLKLDKTGHMNMGQHFDRIRVTLLAIAVLMGAMFAPAAMAQDEAAPVATAAVAAVEAAPAAGYVPMAPTLDKGMPTDPRDLPGCALTADLHDGALQPSRQSSALQDDAQHRDRGGVDHSSGGHPCGHRGSVDDASGSPV